MKRVLVLVNGPPTSVQAPRARALFGTDAEIVFKENGRFRSVPELWSRIHAHDGWIYCVDLGFPSSLLAALRRRTSQSRLVFELGDPMKPLLTPQDRSRAEVRIAHEFDRWLPGLADRIVVRGSYLADYFRDLSPRKRLPPTCWVPDGVDTDAFCPMRQDPRVIALRQKHGLENRFVVGVIGSLHYNPKLNLFYGWDLAEALGKIAADVPITGVVVGDGNGRAPLEAIRNRLGLGDRLKLVGRVPHAEVPLWMNVLDVGLSTQTDDPVGWGRTTAKLPEYLACGTVVACSDVGEAHRFLAATGQTLPYVGLRDDSYPERLAVHLQARAKASTPSRDETSSLRSANRALACREFDYGVLKERLSAFLHNGNLSA